MALGAPLLSIIRNAAEWLADANDSVTLLLSPTRNVFNGDTENYLSLLNRAILLLSVSLKTRILSFKKFTVILVAPN